MNPKDSSMNENKLPELSGSEKLMDRREVLSKVGLYALSTATMMVLMKSQAKATSSMPALPTPTPPPGQEWKRTTRTTS